MGAREGTEGAPGRSAGSRRMLLVVLAPLLAVATLMLGLRVGAGAAVRTASVYAAPPGRPVEPGAPTPIAWQILTYLEDRGVREVVAVPDLTVVARAKGHEARWAGASNADGIAEAVLALPELGPADPVHVEVRAGLDSAPLAEGVVEPVRAAWARGADAAPRRVRPSRREGAIGLDVLVEGEQLVVGFETSLWARLTGEALTRGEAVTLRVAPEPGLRVDAREVGLGCDGWAEVRAVAEGHVTGLGLEAKAPSGASGVWFGALPVARGAFFADVPRLVPAATPFAVAVIAPNPRDVAYVEIDDEQGRVFAAALPVEKVSGEPLPRARFTMPPLAPGLHWLVVSGEPRGAERLEGATIARPFLVDGAAAGPSTSACSLGPWLASRPPTSAFPRWQALDGMASRGERNRSLHRIGLAIGLGSLLVAAALEALLLAAAAREARAIVRAAEADDDDPARIVARAPGGGLAVGILVALLGFALLAALMIAKA